MIFEDINKRYVLYVKIKKNFVLFRYYKLLSVDNVVIYKNARKISFAPENRQPMLFIIITKQHMCKSHIRKTKIYIIFSLRNAIFNLRITVLQ